MSRQFSHFSGIDSCNVGLNCNASMNSKLLCSNESIALAGRPNLHSLLSRKVARGNFSSEFSSSMKEESMRHFPCGSLTKNVQGSTFVPFEETIYIQLGIGEEEENTVSCVKYDCYEGGKCRHSWARYIYIVQTEDIHCYGTQF